MSRPRQGVRAIWLWACCCGALGAQRLPEPDPARAPASDQDSLRRVKAAHARSRAGQGMLLDRDVPGMPLPSWLPRFEEHVEVQAHTLAEAAERHLEGFDPLNGPATSVPNVKELREAADHKPPKGANFVPLIVGLYKLGQRLRGAPPPRYFLYLVRRGEAREPLLREGRLPAEALYGPGVIYEPVAEFAELDEALRAQDELRRRLAMQTPP